MKRVFLIAAAVLAAGSLSRAGVAKSPRGKPPGKRLLASVSPAKPQPLRRLLTVKAKDLTRFDHRKHLIELIGSAQLEVDGLTLNAPRITILLTRNNDDVQEVRAAGGGVRIEAISAQVAGTSPQPIVATCREAIYREANRQITLEGPVEVTGKGKPDGGIIGYSAKAPKAFIDITDNGLILQFEGPSEINLILPDKKPTKAKATVGDSANDTAAKSTEAEDKKEKEPQSSL